MPTTTRADFRMITGKTVAGDRGLGVLGDSMDVDDVNDAPYMEPWMRSHPEYHDVEVRGLITRFPATGTLLADDRTNFRFTPSGPGEQSFDFQPYAAGVAVGPEWTVLLQAGVTPTPTPAKRLSVGTRRYFEMLGLRA